MFESIIFNYELADAWGNLISCVEVIDKETENVRCVYPAVSHYMNYAISKEPSARIIPLGKNELEKFKGIILRHMEIFEVEYVEFPLGADGYINRFHFAIGGLEKDLVAYNIWAYKRYDSRNAKIVLELYDEIAAFLIAKKVNKKYIGLEIEEKHR